MRKAEYGGGLMGYEAKCRVRVVEKGAAREADGTVLLETDELVVRGEARVRIKRTAIQRVTRRAGAVTVTAPTATITLTLGEPAAARWEKKLGEPPKRLVDKLDVKPEAAVLLIGTHDDALCEQLAERTSRLSRAIGAKNRDVVFVDVSRAVDMTRIVRANSAITKRMTTSRRCNCAAVGSRNGSTSWRQRLMLSPRSSSSPGGKIGCRRFIKSA